MVGPARFELATSGLDVLFVRGRQRPRFTTLKQAYWYPVGDISLPRPSYPDTFASLVSLTRYRLDDGPTEQHLALHIESKANKTLRQ